jgi:mannonate dehydratase
MQKLIQSFRWYGPKDPVSLSDIRQAGATNIVTALHEIPNGEIWNYTDILKRQQTIRDAGLEWGVVESLPVTEEIKTQKNGFEEHIENYKQSLAHLGKAGIFTVTYNFMPILDWTRTALDHKLANGYKTLAFEFDDIIYFDLFILKRKNAESSYTSNEIGRAKKRMALITDEEKQQLTENILKGLPGSELSFSLDSFRKMISTYDHIDHETLRSHLAHFLKCVTPTAEQYNIKLVIHPDDPPFDIFGLPRIVSSEKDLDFIFSEVDSVSNGLCFCTGSLGVSPSNNLTQLANKFKHRTHFLHLRSTSRDQNGNFHEANHLEGDANLPEIVKIFVKENQDRNDPIPFRPDHGFQMLDDLHKNTYPGYSCIGRMKGLAEIRGLETGILSMMGE